MPLCLGEEDEHSILREFFAWSARAFSRVREHGVLRRPDFARRNNRHGNYVFRAK
jgi:hypothetical protein